MSDIRVEVPGARPEAKIDAKPDARAEESAAKGRGSEKTEEPDLSKPVLGIDALGNMTLFIPLQKTNEVFSRGMIDVARSEVLKWYAAANQRQRELNILAQKTGFQRFKDKLLRRA